MTATVPAPSHGADRTAALAVPRMAPQRRWRPSLLWLAVALVAVGGLITWRLLLAVGDVEEYLAITRPVDSGATVSPADLTTVQITTDPALNPIHASAIDQVVGRHAAMALLPGTLLTQQHLTDRAIPEPGQQVVGISLAQDQVPNRRLQPDARVLLVLTTDANADPGRAEVASPPLTVSATVVDVGTGEQPGTVLLNVAVPERDGPLVAAQAAAGNVVVVLTTGG